MSAQNEQEYKQEIFQRLEKILKELLRVFHEEEPENQPTIAWDTDIVDDLGVDSVETLDLMNAIEEEFKISPNLSEANTKRKISEIVSYIAEQNKR